MLDEKQKEELFLQLRIKGIEKVKEDWATGIYGHPEDVRSRAPLVKKWIEDQMAEIDKINREEELKIAREANAIAHASNAIAEKADAKSKQANRISIIALIVSTLTALAAIAVEVFKK